MAFNPDWRKVCAETKAKDELEAVAKVKSKEEPKIIEVLINHCYGGFDVSKAAKALYKERTGRDLDDISNNARTDPDLIKIVKELGTVAASSEYSKIGIHKALENRWGYSEYDGLESFDHHYSVDSSSHRSIIFDASLSCEERIQKLQDIYLKNDKLNKMLDSIPDEVYFPKGEGGELQLKVEQERLNKKLKKEEEQKQIRESIERVNELNKKYDLLTKK